MVFWDSGNVAAVKRERVLTAHLQQRDGETLEVRENVQECCLSEQGDFAFPAHCQCIYNSRAKSHCFIYYELQPWI